MTNLARPQSQFGLGGNPVRTLWELKGIKWPSFPDDSESSTCSATSCQARQLEPTTVHEEQEQLKTALIESRMNTVYQPPAFDEATLTVVEESEKIPLSDAMSALLNLAECMDSQKYYYC